MQSLEEMIALFSLISASSLLLPCLSSLFPLLYFILSLPLFTSVYDSKAQMHTIIRVHSIV